MEILFQSIHTIDYKNRTCTPVNPTGDLAKFVSSLFDHVLSNLDVKHFKGRKDSEVVDLADKIRKEVDKKAENWKQTADGHAAAISVRLRTKEQTVQDKIEKIGKVQMGSLVQGLIRKEDGSIVYMLAKVGHSSFVDTGKYVFRPGFPEDEKRIWKSCILEWSEKEDVVSAAVYSNTQAKYWWNDFLELDASNDELYSTRDVMDAVDVQLRQFFAIPGKKKSTLGFNLPAALAHGDYLFIRNAFFTHLSTDKMFTYSTVVDNILDNYEPLSRKPEELKELKNTLKKLIISDRNFTPNPFLIKPKASTTYSLGRGLSLVIEENAYNLGNRLSIVEENDISYLKIQVSKLDAQTQLTPEIERLKAPAPKKGETHDPNMSR